MWSSAAPAAHVSIAPFLKKLRFCPIRLITSSEDSTRGQMMRITSVYVVFVVI
jgi:hypothetical protein